jgi:hypothetical protein
MRRVVVGSAAVCALAFVLCGAPTAGAEPVDACGPDQASAVDLAIAHMPHDPLTQAPWIQAPIASNFDACANLSAVLLTADTKPNSPRQALLFHLGRFVGTTTESSRPYTTLDTAASTKDMVVVVFTAGKTCAVCNDGKTYPVHYQWTGNTAVMVEPIPPAQAWP